MEVTQPHGGEKESLERMRAFVRKNSVGAVCQHYSGEAQRICRRGNHHPGGGGTGTSSPLFIGYKIGRHEGVE